MEQLIFAWILVSKVSGAAIIAQTGGGGNHVIVLFNLHSNCNQLN
jgi:hypothetical protein